MASYDAHPDPAVLTETVRPASIRFLGPPRTGLFWDRWLKAYYEDRVLVTVEVERVTSWPDLACSGEPTSTGKPLPTDDPPSQMPPKNGTGPRVDVTTAYRRLRSLPHSLIAYVGSDGLPVIAPITVEAADRNGLRITGPLPSGGRRAGLLAHRYEPQLIGLETRQHTGWLQGGTYAPHTENGFRAPSNKTLLLLANGFMARRGLKQARALGRG
jgi:hypothetical protein